MQSAHAPLTMIDAIWSSGNRTIRNVLLAVLGSVALWISAKVQVPFYPVPMTMQTFVVLFIGMSFGWRLGAATVVLYLVEGAMGLPVFAGTPQRGLGLSYMVGPTGGYLIGFVAAAAIVGLLGERGWDRRFVTTLAAMSIGTVVIFLFGVLWLGAVVGWDKPVLELGVTPFLPGAVFKIVLAAILVPMAWRLVRR